MSKARLYGESFHTLAEEEGVAEELLSDLKSITHAFNEHPDYVKILDSPQIEREALMSILNEDFIGRANRYTLNLVKVLCEKRMVHNIGECLEEYETLYNRQHNIKTAKVTTAKPLNDSLNSALRNKLEERTGSKIELQNRVEENCIGGMIIEIDGKQIDFSLKTELQNLQEALIN